MLNRTSNPSCASCPFSGALARPLFTWQCAQRSSLNVGPSPHTPFGSGATTQASLNCSLPLMNVSACSLSSIAKGTEKALAVSSATLNAPAVNDSGSSASELPIASEASPQTVMSAAIAPVLAAYATEESSRDVLIGCDARTYKLGPLIRNPNDRDPTGCASLPVESRQSGKSSASPS